MSTEEKFRAAVNVIRSLPKNGSYQPSHDLMLRFYAYFKQATEGPCTSQRPAFWEVVRRMKWEAWSKLGNMSQEEAMNNYVEELKKIVETMSYTDNVASFLGSLGSFYDSVPAEDLELLVGPIIERMRSQPGSPLSGSPFEKYLEPVGDTQQNSSREASPDRVPVLPNGRPHITSSLETSPASSYSASPLPPDAEDDEEEEEFIDTVESEPERFTKDSSLNKTSTTKTPAHHNGIPNGYIPSAVNGHHDEGTLANGDMMAHERGRPRERNSPQVKRASWKKEDELPAHSDVRIVTQAGLIEERQRVVKQPFAPDASELITEAVLRLQNDLETVMGRLSSVEAALTDQKNKQVKPQSNLPSWWPFPGISPQLLALFMVWPFVAHITIAFLQRRRSSNRLL